MRVDLNSPAKETIQRAAEVIRAGGVVLYPADTIYGLGCDPYNLEALERIFHIKQRPGRKGVLLLIPAIDWVSTLSADVPEGFHNLARNLWPGPVTFVLPAHPRLPLRVQGSKRLVGLRWPRSQFLQAWMEKIPGPLVSTSANISGSPPLSSSEDLRANFEGKVDLILDAGPLPDALPSSVVDMTSNPPEMLRAGAGEEEVAAMLARYREENN